MKYSEFAEVYESLGKISSKLEKEKILAEFLKNLEKRGKSEWIYLIRGRAVPDYDSREFGISRQLVIKALVKGFGVGKEEVEKEFRKVGDLGEIADYFGKKKRQRALFSSELTVDKVFDNFQKIMGIEGKGAVDKKMAFVSELLGNAKGKEAKYIIRTLLSDLRIGVADGILRDAITVAFFGEEGKKEMAEKVQEAYDLAGDFAIVLEAAKKGKKALEKVEITPDKPLNVMLPVKVNDIKEAFRIVGKPAAIEHKYDGFRMLVMNDGKEIKLFTRKMENVTKQFPDVVLVLKKHVRAKSFILDCEAVGYDPKTRRNKPFEAISQRIKRKYDIEKLIEKLPVELHVFDILYLDGKELLQTEFKDRRKILEGVIKEEKFVIQKSFQIITDSENVAEKFYKEALKQGEEGAMFKKLDAIYRPGRKVGYIVKLKPDSNEFDLVITGAEYGSGKRGGLLTSYYVACKSGEEYVEVGKVSSGLKEKEGEEGTTYEEMDKMLRPLITEEKGSYVKIKPKYVVAVRYQNIQGSPSYSSGYAMRFPRIIAFRPDRHLHDIATIEDVEKEAKSSHNYHGLA